MTQYETTHYDVNEGISRQMLVLDAFKQSSEVIENDVIPSTYKQPRISGIESPASNLGKGKSNYTTLPLAPLTGYVNFLPKNEIQVQMKWEIGYTITNFANISNALKNPSNYLAVYLPFSACAPSRCELLIGGSSIWNNSFQRFEALASLSSFRGGYLKGNGQIATMRKISHKEPIPGAYFTFKDLAASGTLEASVQFTIDLYTLSPILSNMLFVTRDMGNIRLRLFFDDLDRAVCVSLCTNSVDDGSKFTPTSCIERLPLLNTELKLTYTDSDYDNVDATITFNSFNWYTYNDGIAITQSCFEIEDVSKIELQKYISSDNSLIIPTQVWGTQTSENSGINNIQYVYNIQSFNIHLLAFIFPFYTNSDVVLPNPYFHDINIMLNGHTINSQPYKGINDRLVKDIQNAFCNNEHTLNDITLNSLMPIKTNKPYYEFTSDSDATDFYSIHFQPQTEALFHPELENNFIIAQELSAPNCFEKGYCLASNRQGASQVQFNFSNDRFVRKNLFNGYDSTTPPKIVNKNQVITVNNMAGGNAKNYAEIDHAKNSYCLALQDACIYLNYDPIAGQCSTGTVMYALPTIE